MIKKTFKLDGLHCTSCAVLIEGDLEDSGVRASCHYAKETMDVEFDPSKTTEADIKKTIAKNGYRVVE